MEGLLQFLPLIAIAIAGIYKALKGEESNKAETQTSKPRQTTQRTNPTSTPSRANTRQTPAYETIKPSVSVEEEQKQQLERLASSMNTSVAKASTIHRKDLSLGTVIQDEIKHHGAESGSGNQEQFKRQMKKRLSGEGFVYGVIMSEVLGPPRARKPYRNVLMERKNK
ncbi:hypothetical protein [Ornithinibacillus contaminans]|uniref:hypothetical protein n=1 Tax=Ornithinibacillus contaminans TaxID=694055 RepID=UPI00064E0F5D|nr:hypothetical protein [Ornithinibacillus contaminans]